MAPRKKTSRPAAPPIARDPAIASFAEYLRVERNASEHTVAAYLSDIEQFSKQLWGEDAQPP